MFPPGASPMAEEPTSKAPEQLEKPEGEGGNPPPKPPPPPSKRKERSSAAAAAAAAVSSADAAVVTSSSVTAKEVVAKTSGLETLAIPVPATRNLCILSNGSPGGGEGRSFSQLLAGAMASPVGTSHATPILAVPVDAVRLPVVAVPCIIAPAALLESPGFAGQFAMTHQAVLATVTAQAQMQLQSGFTPPALISSPVSAQKGSSSASEDKALSSVVEQPPSSDQKLETAQIVVKTTSGDGFNWRKYGQKQVKSGENSRSYYKCTQANCSAKKKVECCQDGRVVEIIYRGGHNHDPPQKTKCSKQRGHQFSSPPGDNETSTPASGDTNGSEPSPSKMSCHFADSNDPPQKTRCSKVRKTQSSRPPGVSETLTLASRDTNASEPLFKMEQNSGSALSECQLHCSNDCEGDIGIIIEEGRGQQPDPKRKFTESPLPSPSSLFKTAKEPKVVVQTVSDVGLVSDGYRWRKYGQKIVKGNPNPRSYYRCTQIGCPVRKHVERDSADAKAVIITYEGKHNHEPPPAKHEGDPPVLLIAAAAAAAVISDKQTQAPSPSVDKQLTQASSPSVDKRPKEQQTDRDSEMPEEKPSELGGDTTLESAQTLLSIGLKSTPEETDDRESSDAIQRPLFDENRAAVPVQNS